MTALLIVLTVLEILALVAGLAFFLHLLAGRLSSIAQAVARLDAQVGSIEKDLGILKVGAPVINTRLREVVGVLSEVADKARLVARR